MWASFAKAIILDNLTDNLAASSKSETGKIFIPEVAINTFASSTFVPYILQTHRRKKNKQKHNVYQIRNGSSYSQNCDNGMTFLFGKKT